MEHDIPFKKCSLCLKEWQNKADFLADPQIRYEGYQACFDHPEAGLLLFGHMCENGGSTLGVSVHAFAQMAHEHKYQINLSQDMTCPMYCWDPFESRLCPMHCSMAWTREIIRSIAQTKEHRVGSPGLRKYP